MPSEPRPARGMVRVRHPKFGEKTVQRSRLSSLSSNWSRVSERKRKTPPSAPTSTATDPAEPDIDKE